MAKRGSSTDFNMAEEIRTLLAADQNLTGRDVINALKQKWPKVTINENSCSVAFANARRKLGLGKVRRRRPKSTAPSTPRPWSRKTSSETTAKTPVEGIELLLAAKQLLQQCGGDAGIATAALKQVASLQMS